MQAECECMSLLCCRRLCPSIQDHVGAYDVRCPDGRCPVNRNVIRVLSSRDQLHCTISLSGDFLSRRDAPMGRADCFSECAMTKILLVEDQPTAAAFLAQGLHEAGMAVDVATSG